MLVLFFGEALAFRLLFFWQTRAYALFLNLLIRVDIAHARYTNVSLGTMEKLLTKLIGDAGEHYVAFELARRGASPAMLSTNTKGADILATISGRKVVSIQVKASAGSNDPRTWAVGKKSTHPSPNFFYVFLNVWSDFNKPIECFIVPSEVVLNSVNWQASMPQFRMKTSAVSLYLNNWELILSELKIE